MLTDDASPQLSTRERIVSKLKCSSVISLQRVSNAALVEPIRFNIEAISLLLAIHRALVAGDCCVIV